MGNKGAFVTMQGGDLKPNFTAYEAVVSSAIIHQTHYICMIRIVLKRYYKTLLSWNFTVKIIKVNSDFTDISYGSPPFLSVLGDSSGFWHRAELVAVLLYTIFSSLPLLHFPFL